MTDDLYLRTEDIDDKNILSLYVETPQDADTLRLLKSSTPTILVGSRGVGKSFLMKVAYAQLKNDFPQNRVLPVYLTFIKSSLVAIHQTGAFLYWMLAKISHAIVRELQRSGFIVKSNPDIDLLSGGRYEEKTIINIDSIRKAFEDSWKENKEIDTSAIPPVEELKEAVSDICEENQIKRIILFIDEAAHIFIREQQTQFFTLFRDLRCPCISCKAAVYPGVTAFGDTFQYSQDASFINLNRSISEVSYVDGMKNMVLRQVTDSSYQKELSRKGQAFTDLTYAASGNPRFLLSNIRNLPKFGTSEINQSIKDFYRVAILSNHTALSSKYPNLKELIDWGRTFLDDVLLPEMRKRNSEALVSGKSTTSYFWIHKDAPEPVKRAIALLEYSGLVQEVTKGIKASGGEIGTRYMVNLGCLLSLEANPLNVSHEIIKSLDIRKIVEFGMNNSNFNSIKNLMQTIDENDLSHSLEMRISQNLDVLPMSNNMKAKLHELGLNTIKDVLNSTEAKLKQAYYVGDKRARMMKNVALTSVYEYLIG